MSLPEISRRCLACGAAVRPGARFCPQCGHNLGAEGEVVEAARETRVEEKPSLKETAPHPAVEDTVREEPRPLRATRDAETLAGGASPTIGPTPPASAEPPAPATRETAAQVFESDSRRAADARGDAARTGAANVAAAPTNVEAALTNVEAAPAEAGGEAATPDAGAAAGRSRRAAARVRETVMPRVEKMRDEALVALDESPDDSGLRFVLIAVFLFGLFLLFLFLSTTVLR